jgi:hypothetical protein
MESDILKRVDKIEWKLGEKLLGMQKVVAAANREIKELQGLSMSVAELRMAVWDKESKDKVSEDAVYYYRFKGLNGKEKMVSSKLDNEGMTKMFVKAAEAGIMPIYSADNFILFLSIHDVYVKDITVKEFELF